MTPVVKPPARFAFQAGSLGTALDVMIAEQLHLSEGEEVELREEEGRIVIEAVRPKILEPVSDLAAREERKKRVAEATEHAMKKHHDLLALLAK